MEERTPAYFNSPVIRRNTPLKRLGLSRKRKSRGFDADSSGYSQSENNKLLMSSDGSPNVEILKCNKNPENVNLNSTSNEYVDVKDENSNKTTDCDDEIEILNRIKEKEEKLKFIQTERKNITDLENLLELWKSGCKSAYLHFIHLLKQSQQENINYKKILEKLGIWETMIENFGNDSDLCLLECSQ